MDYLGDTVIIDNVQSYSHLSKLLVSKFPHFENSAFSLSYKDKDGDMIDVDTDEDL